MSQLHDYRKYIDAGKRTAGAESAYNVFLDTFVSSTEARTKEDIANRIIASDWRPPTSEHYKFRQEKIDFLMGYLNKMAVDGFLKQKIA